MAEETKKPKLQQIKPGTPEMEALLQAGYAMTIEEAKRIVKERDANTASHPYELYQNAKAMLAAYEAKPIAISTRPAYKRQPVR